MKKLLLLILLFISVVAKAQKGISYQAVILDPAKIELPGQDIAGQPLVNGNVWVKFSIISGTSIQFEEVQQTKTDAYGLVNLTIGSVANTAFNAMTWDATQKSLQVFVSFNNGASYTKVSDQKLSYSPYALFAETAGKLGSTLGIAGGGTGATTAAGARANLGLGNVDNTADADKPISTATQAALNLKANAADVNAALALKASAADLAAHLAVKADTSMLASKAALTDLNNYAPINSPTFTGTVTSPQFVLIGGLPTQYLMADGSTSNVTAKNLFSTDINVNGLNIGKGSGAIATNTSIGLNVLSTNTSGYFNAGVGDNALSKNTTGFENTALGHIALLNNTTGSFNTAVGKESLARNTIGGSNTAIGVNSLVSNINGGSNIAIGNNSLFNNVSGNNNTGVGFGALVFNQTGSTLTAIGKDADVSVDGLTNAIAIGYNAKVGASNTIQLGNNSITSVKTNGVVTASGYIVAGGTSSQYLMADGSVSAGGSSTVNLATSVTGVLPIANGGTGSNSKNFVDLTTNQTISGYKTFSSDVSVNGVKIGRGLGNNGQNVAIGADALASGTGTRNTAVGYGAMRQYSGTSFDNNSSVGYFNMPSLTTGSGNTSVGAESMLNLLTGTSNTSIGNQSLISVTGSSNVGVGKRSGQTITSGSQNTIVGTDADVSSATLNNATAVGYGAQVSASNTVQLGNSSVTNVKTSGTFTAGAITYPKVAGTNGQVLTTDGSGSASWSTPSSSQWTTATNDIYFNTGNVGIGISSPGSGFNTNFDLQGRASFRTNGANSGMIFDGYSPSGSLQVARIYTDATSGTPSDFILGTYPNGHMKQLYLKQSNGFVGVNNDNPTQQLDVSGSIKSSGAITAGSGSSTIAGSLVVGANNSTGTSAALEVNSTTQGLLLPRLTTAQRDAIVNPTQGLMVFCTSAGPSGQLQVFNGSTWTNFIGGTAFKAGKLYNYRSSVLYSFDGATWTNTGIGVPNNGFNGASGTRSYIGTIGGKTYHHDPYTQTTYSFDGASWTTESSTVPNNGFNGAVGGRSYVGVINNKAYHWDPYTQLFYSFDGTTWVTVSGGIPNTGFNGAVGSRSFVGVINNKAYHWDPYAQVFYSFDGTTWATVQGGVPNNGFNGAISSRSYVGVINNKAYHYDPYGQLFYSFNGTSWTTENITVPNFNGSLGAGRSYVGVLDNKAYHYNSYTSTLYSFDGIVWQAISTNTPSSIGGWLTDMGSTSFVGIAW